MSAETGALLARTLALLEHFTSDWDEPGPTVGVQLRATEERAEMGPGRFLHCRGMRVDRSSSGLVAICESGAQGRYDSARRHWDLFLPTARTTDHDGAAAADNVEGLMELVLTTAWREAGWVPLHAGAVVREGCCALLVAPSKGGKSTLTVALLHCGWRTLGDDKTLLTWRDGRPEIRGLTKRFSIDPQTRRWFPEVGDLEPLPRISRWTPKRRLEVGDIWGRDCFVARAEPTHIVRIERSTENRPTRAEPLGRTEVLAAMLRQTVIPADPEIARRILAVIAPTARALRGVRLDLGHEAYRDPAGLEVLERMLS